MTEDRQFYKDVCEKRFDYHQKSIDKVDETVDKLMVIVENGLTQRVKRIDKLIWLIAVVVIGKVIVDIFI